MKTRRFSWNSSPLSDESSELSSWGFSCVTVDDVQEQRDRWGSRINFVLSSVGAVVGLGIFWRYPYLCFKHGGAIFFIPHVVATFVVGIPLMQLELTLGQIYQKGSVKALAAISPRVAGVGFTASYGAYVVISYYTVLVAWISRYLITSLVRVPWYKPSHFQCEFDVSSGVDRHANSTLNKVRRYLYLDFLGAYEDIDGVCKPQYLAQDTQWMTFISILITWVLIYLCVYKGFQHTVRIAYLTVGSSAFLMIALVIDAIVKNPTGFASFIYSGNLGQLGNSSIWVDAVSQSLFSLSLATGTMIPFGSYRKKDRVIVSDTIVIASCNCIFSFLSAFFAWLVAENSIEFKSFLSASIDHDLQRIGLVFITYPVAFEKSRMWLCVVFLLMFIVGLDSSCWLLEGLTATVQDTNIGSKLPRHILLLFVIAPCLCLGLFFAQDTGLFWLYVVDHYNQYLLILVASLHSFVIGWLLGTPASIKLVGKLSYLLFVVGYAFTLFFLIAMWLVGCLTHSLSTTFMSIVFLIALLLTFWVISFKVSNVAFKTWIQLFITGPNIFTDHWLHCSSVSNGSKVVDGAKPSPWKESYGCFYRILWSTSIKFIIPGGLSILAIVGIRQDLNIQSLAVPLDYQYLGWSMVIIGILIALTPLVVSPFYVSDDNISHKTSSSSVTRVVGEL